MIEGPLRRRMMRLEVTMDELGVMPLVRLRDVDMLRRQQLRADQAQHSNEGETATRSHCGNYPCRATAASILS